MTTFLLYDLKVALLIVVFYMFYRLLAARETFHQLNRMVLLGSLVLSLVLPLCVVTVHQTVEVTEMPQPMVSVGMAEVGEIVEDGLSGTAATVLAFVYFVGVVFCLARTSFYILSVRRMIARCREVPVPSFVRDDVGAMRLFVADDEKIQPFSWMRSVVLSRKDYEQDLAAGARGHSIVLAHESGHVACRHSVDMLFVDAIVALQWFNPVVWLLRQDLRTVHEYEADARVLSQGFNAYQYLSLLVQKAAGDAGYSVANGISMSSIISKRVIMMTKNQSSRYSWAKLLYIVPIVAISLAATAKTVIDYKVVEVPESKAEKTLANDSVLMIPEKMPVFPGGDKALLEFLSKNIKYPVEAQKKGVQGRVVVSFVVEKDGSLSDVKTAKSVAPLLDKEAVRVVKSMPKWLPGRQKGKAVRVKYNVPISFKLNHPVAKSDGQTAPALRPADSPSAQPSASSGEKTFEVVEQMPTFPGGDRALMEFVSKNVKYPVEAQEKGEQGRVVVGFIVEKDGTISDAKVVNSNRYTEVEITKDGTVVKKLEKAQESAGTTLEAEALRVVESMPKWTSGKHKGKAVRVKFNIPVMFRLQ